MVRRCGVLGSPIGHTLSPALHRAAYTALGLHDWRYDAREVDQAGLPTFLRGLDPSWRGLSLTRPLKETVIPLLDDVSRLARAVRAVNTVLVDWPGGSSRPRLSGHNTDVFGIEQALRSIDVQRIDGDACVIGAGATAASAVAALTRLGATRLTVLARRPGAAGGLLTLSEQLGAQLSVVHIGDAARVLSRAEVAVCTLPAGAADALTDRFGAVDGALLDVVYAGWPTPLARAWRDGGGRVVGGAVMLLHQAAEQVRLMTGCSEDVLAAMATALPESAGVRWPAPPVAVAPIR